MSIQKKSSMLFIVTSPLYLEKGSSLRTYALLKILSEYYRIDVVCYTMGRRFCLDNVRIHRTPSWFKPVISVNRPTLSKLILDFFILLKAFRLSLQNHYDLIHCEDFESLAVGCSVRFLNANSKLVYDLHNRVLDNLHLKETSHTFDFPLLKLEKYFVSKCDKIILNWAKYLEDDLFCNKKKFLFYDPIETRLEKIRSPVGNYLIYSGNFEDYQGLQNFIRVFAGTHNDELNLILVGELDPEIIRFIRSMDLFGRVFPMGRLTVEKTNWLINGAVAGVLPRVNGSSMKTIHYIYCHKPVFAFDTRSNRELISHGVNGFLYSSDDELKEILNITATDPERMKSLCKGVEKTRKKIAEILDKQRFIREYKTQ